MAKFTWSAGTSDDWNTISDWTPTKDAPPGALAGNQDQVVFDNTHSGWPTTYTASVATGEAFDLSRVSLRTSHGHHAVPTLSISGNLLTGELVYSGHYATPIIINAGGLLDIGSEISDRNGTHQTITIAADNGGAVGSGGRLEFGSPTVNDPHVAYRFLNEGPTSINTGEIEFQTGFKPGITTTQHISNIAQGDEIVFSGADFTGDTVSLSQAGELTVTNGDGATVLTMDNISMAGGATPAFHAFGDTIEAAVACYVLGTRILTPSGEIPIEDLAIGDLVITRSGEAKPIKWIGRRSYQGRFIAGNRDLLPIRFATGALAEGKPSRDLDVSPKHAMFIDDLLVPAEMLLNGINVCQLEGVESVEYFHLELAAHDVIFANGAASETFVDCDSRGMFHNAIDFARLYPDDPGPTWQFCAPRVEPASAALVEIRARLMARAGSTESFCPRETLRGNIDQCDRIRVAGWVFDPTNPNHRVRLEIRYDGEVVGHVVADRYRRDLEDVGYLGDGCCSFNFQNPVTLDPLAGHAIEILRAADGAPVPGSPVMLSVPLDFDTESRAGVTRMLRDAAQAATQSADLDDIIGYMMTESEALLAARARLDVAVRADVANMRERWGGLLPSAAGQRAARELRPQALFVDEFFPAAGVNGGASAAIDHMRSLMRVGFDVSFAASQDLDDRFRRRAELTALGIKPLLAPWYGSIEEILRRQSGRIDLVYLHRAANAAAYGKLVRQYCSRALLVYGVADLHHVRLARQGAVEDRPEVSRLAERLQIEEMVAARLADVVITHSNAEAEFLRARVPGVRVALVPWSVPVRTSTTGFAGRDGVVFVGHFGHEPNLDAAYWLAKEIVPLVHEREAAIHFCIVGNDMPDSLRKLAEPGLELVASVAALDTLLAKTRLTVAPLRYGAGLKAKVLDSLAAGVPCVGTSIAFEGFTLPSALADCVADTPEAIATALVRLYRDEAAHAIAAEAGQRYALVNHGEGSVDALMQQALAPWLRRWAGIADELRGGARAMQMAG
jgi:glycosyltransferase involved in cell wall biosynthesis